MLDKNTQQYQDALKQATHRGRITGVYYRVKDDSTLADFLWESLAIWCKSNVTREIIENNLEGDKARYEKLC